MIFYQQSNNYYYLFYCWIPYSGWLQSSDDPLGYVDRIDQRIEDLTGLDMSTAEQLQVYCMYIIITLLKDLVSIVHT